MKTIHERTQTRMLLVLPLALALFALGSAAQFENLFAASEAKPLIRLFNDPAPSPAENVSPIDPENANLPSDVKGESEVIAAQLIVEDHVVTDQEISDDARITENGDGTTAVEFFDGSDKRTEKLLRGADDRLLERWIFDPSKNGRITHYEKYAYQDGKLESYRAAAWEYGEKKEFVKTNRFFDSAGRQTGHFLEYAGTNGEKFREEWFDAEKNPSAVKSWDPVTGEFQGHILIKDYPFGMKRVEWADGNRKTVRKELVRSVDMKKFEEMLAPQKPRDDYRKMRLDKGRDLPPVY